MKLDDLDSDPWLLNAQNGIIDLRTGALLPHDRTALCSRIVAVDYDPDAKSDLFDSYLRDITRVRAADETVREDPDLAAFIRRAVGYSLVGEATERAFFFLYGQPGTGKSTFIELIGHTLGTYAETAASTTWLKQTTVGGNRGDLVRLAGARFVCSSEFQAGAKFDEALLKEVSGGDKLTAAAKYEAEVSFKPRFALWLAANDAPKVRDGDEGLWVRLRRIPLDVPFDCEDKTMRDRLRPTEVLRAVLAWSVRGCLEWQQQRLGTCEAVRQSGEAYRREMSSFESFLDERCEFGPDFKIESNQLRHAYEGWCRDNRREAQSDRMRAKALQDRGCATTRTAAVRQWRGLRITGFTPTPFSSTGGE